MGKKTRKSKRPAVDLRRLERHVIAMGNMVESLFADAVVALMDRNFQAVPELREEDYRAHERWLEIDKLCVDFLCDGNLDEDGVRFVSSAIKIAGALKRMADESLLVGGGMRACGPELPPAAESLAAISPMVERTQAMLSSVMDAFVNRDCEEAAGLHLAYRELALLDDRAVEQLGKGIMSGGITVQLGTEFVGMAQRLQRIGHEVLDVSNQVSHLYRRAGEQ